MQPHIHHTLIFSCCAKLCDIHDDLLTHKDFTDKVSFMMTINHKH